MPSRTFHWDDTAQGRDKIAQLSGLEFLQAMSAGSLPLSPLVSTLDFTVETVEKGRVTFSFQPGEFHYNPLGSVHGGVLSALLDSAMGCTLHSMLEPGISYTTLELKTNFLKAANVASGKLRATGKMIHLGKRTALLEAALTDEQGRIYAHGTSTCLILKP